MRRIIFLIAIFLLTLSPLMGQDPQVVLPEDGNWPTIVGDSIMLIGPKQEALTEEQRYFNPPYLLVYPGKEHLKEQMIRAALCDCDPTQPNRRIGVFSVAADKQVSFSQGNLQYLPSLNIWKFADSQYEYLGNANKYLSPTFRNWVDLFGWSANNTTAPFGVSTSTNVADYAGDFVDWGTNTICGDTPNTWRTLSIEEWKYLYHERKNAEKLFALGTINGIAGMILLPDDWQLPEGATCQLPTEKGLLWDDNYNGGGYINTNTQANHYQDNIYTLEQWQVMEEAGAVFLPAAGYRENTNFSTQSVNPPSDYVGSYATSTITDGNNYYFMRFIHREVRKYSHSLYRGRAVRLVHDTIVPETIPDPCLVVKVNDTLSINMMCVEGGTFRMGEGEEEHQITLSDYTIGQTEVTQAVWEAVMGTNPSANTANKQLPVTNISWYDCQEFIKKLNQQTGMRFRLPTEAEWEYAARGGQKSKGYTYAGSNDLKEVAWYNGNSGNTLHAVAQKKPNELGIYDMSGNVWEWCHDWHAPYPTTHQYNPLGPEVGQVVGKRYIRMFRGGSYGYEASYQPTTFRDVTGPEPDKGTANLGLRLVLSEEVNFQTIHVNDTLAFHMMDVKGGTFMMGDDNTSNASPAHQVTLSDYYIGQTEVTQALWKAVMGNIPTGNKNPSYPVGYVGYADCQDFIAKLNNLTGLYFQLPTEAEWEYAAMGGNRSHGHIYSGSNTIDDVAWYDENSGNKLHHVGAKQPNELGIYDMSGNAWEWCADYHGKYTAENQINPQGPATGTDRVIRSGSFRTTADRCTNKHRQAREADYPDSHITLRLVLHDTIVPKPPKRIGVFSVAADKQVSFSQGNLQYISSSDTWCFANQQWDYLGEQNRQGERIDLFDWSKDAIGKFFDWGNYIINSDIPNIWRTLSKDEYTYLLHNRERATELMGGAMIEGISGLVVLPDDWECPQGVEFISLSQLDCTWDKNQKVYQLPPDIHELNNYSVSEWQIMEQVGAVFLPTAGYIDKNAQLQQSGMVARYWSSSPHSYTKGYYLSWSFAKDLGPTIRTQSCVNPDLGHSVRLVHDTIVPTPEPEYVDLGLSVKWATFNVGATSPEDYGDYFAWGENEPKEQYSWTNYKWCDGTINNMTKYNATDGKTILEPVDDAATANWGDKWRMPTNEEMQELFDNCTWTEETRNGINGYIVTGPNGNSIFLPRAGFYNYDEFGDGLQYKDIRAYYWTNTRTIDLQGRAYDLGLNTLQAAYGIVNNTRRLGFPIRPVYDATPRQIIEQTALRINLPVQAIEKDIWVTTILQIVFSLPIAEQGVDYSGDIRTRICLLPREDIAAVWQKDYEVMCSSMIHRSAPTWTKLIEQITILQNSVRNKC